jgi:predicted GTPase
VTGHGKSSTANSLAGSASFKISSSVNSETDNVKGLATTFQGENDQDKVIIIDTPGIGDSKGRDTEHIANMVYNLKQIGFVHTFLVIINSEENRFNE